MRKLLSFGIVFLVGAGCAHAPETRSAPPQTTTIRAGTHHRILSVKEIMQRIDASPIKYEISASSAFTEADREEAATHFWGDSKAALPEWVKDASGTLTLGSASPPAGVAEAAYLDAENAFAQHDFAEAERDYEKALATAPGNYIALLAWGETALYQRKFEVAVDRFTQAIKADPWAHPAYAYRGETLLALGKRDEAVMDYARALARRPRWPVLLKEIEVRQAALRVRLAPDRLLPAVRVTRVADGIKIEADRQHPGWLGFGACKAFWMVEESHRVEMTGSPRHEGTSIEERECLAALLDSYVAMTDGKKFPADPALDQAVAIVKDGYSSELVIYEILSRMDGNVVATLPPSEVGRLEQFVRKYVLLDDAPAAPSDAPSAPAPDPKTGSISARR